MKYCYHLLGFLCGFALMIVLLITSIEAVTYWTPDYYKNEYEKYQVLDQIHMEMDDLLDVTEEMMQFLRGNREDLHITTTIDGQEREFFNEREIAHMNDVQGLFLKAIALRRICIALIALSLVLLMFTKARLHHILPRMICTGAILFFITLALLGGLISTNFSKYFVIFHKIFFDNDLWLLDPNTDLLINIVPEPFFVDTAVRIAITYGLSVLAVFAICLLWMHKKRPIQLPKEN